MDGWMSCIKITGVAKELLKGIPVKVVPSNHFYLKYKILKGIFEVHDPSPRFNLSLWHRPNPRNHQTRPNIHHSHNPKDPSVIITIIPSDQEIHNAAQIPRSASNASNET